MTFEPLTAPGGHISAPAGGNLRRTAPQLIRAADGFIIFLAGISAYFIYIGGLQGQFQIWPRYVLTSVLGALLIVFLIKSRSTYMPHVAAGGRQIWQGLLSWTAVVSALLIAAFIFKISDTFSRVWVGTWYVSGLTYFAASRIWLNKRFEKWTEDGSLAESCVIVAVSAKVGRRLLKRFRDDERAQLRIEGICWPSAIFDSAELDGVPIYRTIDELVSFSKQNNITRVIVALSHEDASKIEAIISAVRFVPAKVQVFYDQTPGDIKISSVEIIGALTLLTLHERPLDDWSLLVKRVEDLVIASLALMLSSPLLLLIGLALKADSSGPILFKQKRYGFGQELIKVYKFRTMYHDQRDDNAHVLVSANDPRVTRVGRVLRRTSLDELPQLLNVLRGDMSMVGPRPHATQAKAAGALYPDAVPNYFMRYRIRPGLTGLAQVNGWRGETDTLKKLKMRVDHDLLYIDSWSVTLDLAILFRTATHLLRYSLRPY